MQFRILYIVFLTFTRIVAFGQYDIHNDKILNALSDSLPKGWTMSIVEGQLVIQRTDSVCIEYHNHINEPVMSEEEVGKANKAVHRNNNRILLIYRIEPVWSKKEWRQKGYHNDTLYTEIEKQKKICGLEKIPYHLDAKPSGFYYPYYPKTKDDTLQLDKFRKIEPELRDKMIQMPIGETEKLELFATKSSCFDDNYDPEFIDIFPKEANAEMFRICDLISHMHGTD